MSEDYELSIEVNPTLSPTTQEVGFRDKIKKIKLNQFKNSLSILPKLADALETKLSEITKKPEKVELELGLSIDLEGKIYVVGINANSSISVKLTWDKEKLSK